MTKYELATGCENYQAESLEDGTTLYLKVPHVAPFAWFHAFFGPLSSDEVRQLEIDMPSQLHSSFLGLLNIHNGMRLFSGEIWIGGLRKSSGRSIRDAWQPFSIISVNQYERPLGLPVNSTVIGGYEKDGHLVYIDDFGKVHLCTSHNADAIFSWCDLDTFLLQEIDRIGKYYNRFGVKCVKEKVTSYFF